MESTLRTVIASLVVVLLPAGIGLFQGRSRLQDVTSRVYLALPATVKAWSVSEDHCIYDHSFFLHFLDQFYIVDCIHNYILNII